MCRSGMELVFPEAACFQQAPACQQVGLGSVPNFSQLLFFVYFGNGEFCGNSNFVHTVACDGGKT